MNKLNLKNHPLLTSASDITDICEPLQRHFNITYFRYMRNYDAGQQVSLCNNAQWSDFFYLEKEYYRISHFEKQPSQYQTGYVLWDMFKNDSRILQEGSTRFQIDNGVTLIERQHDSTEFFHFGTTTENTAIVNTYLNNIDLFKQFTRYFKEKAALIIKQAEAKKIVLPIAPEIRKQPIDAALRFNQAKTDAFMSEISIKQYRLEGKLKGVTLSEREFECTKHLVKGKTAKNIAEELKLSPRTVEGYINKIKIKTDCHTRSALISLLLDNGIN